VIDIFVLLAGALPPALRSPSLKPSEKSCGMTTGQRAVDQRPSRAAVPLRRLISNPAGDPRLMTRAGHPLLLAMRVRIQHATCAAAIDSPEVPHCVEAQ
jgi:hypothetical protein